MFYVSTGGGDCTYVLLVITTYGCPGMLPSLCLHAYAAVALIARVFHVHAVGAPHKARVFDEQAFLAQYPSNTVKRV